MKKVLCFGDSNVYGFIPENGKRYPKNVRWSGILAGLAGADYKIVEEGCNNRTAFSNNPDGAMMSGLLALPEVLKEDFDIVILAVGINDLQYAYNVQAADFENGLERLIAIVKRCAPNAEIVLLSPSVIGENILKSFFAALFDRSSIEKSHLLSGIYEKTARKNGCKFLDLNAVSEPSQIDGLHYSPQAHSKIAHAVWKIISA